MKMQDIKMQDINMQDLSMLLDMKTDDMKQLLSRSEVRNAVACCVAFVHWG